MNQTIDFYNNNANEYIKQTFSVNMSSSQNIVLNALSKLEKSETLKILDVGAGSGRESLFFKSHGYDVTALEPSKSLAELIRKNIKCNVIELKAQEINFDNKFDGIIAFASLLHIPKKEIKNVIERIHDAMKPGGVFFMTLKKGDGESFDKNNRFFAYYQQEEIRELLSEFNFESPFFVEDESQIAPGTIWINSLVTKKIQPELVPPRKLSRKNI